MDNAMEMRELISNRVVEPDALAQLVAELTERPRERLWRCGTQAVGDAELVALVLGTGVRGRPVLAVAADRLRVACPVPGRISDGVRRA